MKNNSFVLKGFLKEVLPVKTFPTFSVREVVVETEEDYPQPIAFELYGDNVGLVDGLAAGQSLNVFFSQRGRTHNGRTFVTNRAWKVEALEGGKAATAATPAPAAKKSAPAAKQAAPAVASSDEAPF